MKKNTGLVLAAAVLLFASCSAISTDDAGIKVSNYGYVSEDKSVVATGIRTVDTDGNDVFGSGGCMLQVGEYFYWYGEHRFSNYKFKGVSCYRSRDLVNWENRGDIITWDDVPITSEGESGHMILERPKVVYNPNNGKYVMWGHLDYDNYGLAAVLVCEGDSPDDADGSWKYVDWFRPFDDPQFEVHDSGSASVGDQWTRPYGWMSRDCTLFVDDDGTGYFASSYNENAHTHIYRLTKDFRHVDTSYWPVDNVLQDASREAPCLFREGDTYYMVTSGTAGWTSTATKIQYAKNLQGPWSSPKIIGDTTEAGQLTFSDRSQPAFVMKLEATDGSGNHDWLYMGDRWGPAFGGSSPYDSQYVWCKLVLDGDNSHMYFSDALEIDIKKGKIDYAKYHSLISRGGNYLKNPDNALGGQVVEFGSANSNLYKNHWRFLPMKGGYMIINRWSGMVLSSVDKSFNSEVMVASRDSSDLKQIWYVEDFDKPYHKLKNAYSGLYLTGWDPINHKPSQCSWAYRNPYWTADGIITAAEYDARINDMAWKF